MLAAGPAAVPRARALVAALVALALTPGAALAAPASEERSRAAWRDAGDRPPPPARAGARPEIRAERLRALTLDRGALARVLAGAPRERSGDAPLAIALPAPDGGFERFEVERNAVLAPELAARHPEISTWAGRGLDDPGATVRLDLGPLGLHASVRSPAGSWYVDPYYHRDESAYASYYGRDLEDVHGDFVERYDGSVVEPAAPAPRSHAGDPEVDLRIYRLALLSDPAYAAYHGSANVLAAKTTLVNRMNQVYEDDLAIRMVLIAATDSLNLDTAAKMTGANGPCGAAACYTSDEASTCSSPTLARTRIVLGQLARAGEFDVGHLMLGTAGGGIASLGVVGGNFKARGCTGLTTPVGDQFAIDYLAHEIGHQFAGNHTFNGTQSNCSGSNRNAPTSVEPGSGTTVMAYAGICGVDDLQAHSDPYFSQRSIDEIQDYVGSARSPIDEVQTVSLQGLDAGDSFRLAFEGEQTDPIVRGTNYSAAGIEAAIEALPGWPAGASVVVAPFGGGGGGIGPEGFQVTFGGTLAATATSLLGLADLSGASGFVGETARGGPVQNGGSSLAPTGNHAPAVSAPGPATIPARTPFSLTASATDADGDPLLYSWEQNDRGGTNGTALLSNSKSAGPLFRQFSTEALVDAGEAAQSPSPGQNAASIDPTRHFPDLAQVVSGNTNAVSGTCPTTYSAAAVECHSEFLPTSSYVGFLGDRRLNFRVTVRDGDGGVGSADTSLTVAPSAGPFRVTSQASPGESYAGGGSLPVTWSVASTDLAPVGVSQVRILLSEDGGATFPHVLAAATANDGSQTVALPAVVTTRARVRVQAVGNVFFAVNGADFMVDGMTPTASNSAPAGGVSVQYSDALAAPLTVSASDPDSNGSALSASAAGLPAGMSLVPGTTSGDGALPGTRTWTVNGATTAAPGSYPVTVTVTDETARSAQTSFTVVVTREDASASYAGPATAAAPAGASSAGVRLAASVIDSAGAAGSGDSTAGNVATATVAFVEGGTTLCSAAVAASGATAGTAACDASLAVGSHAVSVVVGGRYAGQATATVRVDGAASGDGGTAGPGPELAGVVRLAPDLGRVARRLRISRTRRVGVRIGCVASGGLGALPAEACTGSAALTARVGGRSVRLGQAALRIAPGTARVVRVRLGARALRALGRSAPATLTVQVANADGTRASARRRVRLVR